MFALHVKIRDLYYDWRIVAGLLLMVVGIGNWLVGLIGTEQYKMVLTSASQISADDTYRNFFELDERKDRAVLAPLTTEQRKVSLATAHMDFYHAVFLTGQVIFTVGLVTSCLGFLTVIRRDARRVIRQSGADFALAPRDLPR